MEYLGRHPKYYSRKSDRLFFAGTEIVHGKKVNQYEILRIERVRTKVNKNNWKQLHNFFIYCSELWS